MFVHFVMLWFGSRVRQVLTKLNLASAYAGQEKPDGAEYHVEPQV